ncbi:MAG: tRNA (adenosine(37)-N6)-threonylcarbamoyltransferase complex ATPase subunit type 1 TsaE [Halothiobacillus sp.]
MNALELPRLDEPAVATLAGALARTAPRTGLMFLEGSLGAGKTTFARAFLRALGVRGTVRSPTYTLIEPYDLADRRVLHLDLYRLASPEELDDLGLRDEFDQALILIEWPERGAGELPLADICVALAPVKNSAKNAVFERDIHVTANTPKGTQWLNACQSVGQGGATDI